MASASSVRRAASRAAWTAGSSIPIKTPTMAITTSNSISVKPRCFCRDIYELLSQQAGGAHATAHVDTNLNLHLAGGALAGAAYAAIAAAEGVNPPMVTYGLSESLLTPVTGMVIFVVAAFLWFFLSAVSAVLMVFFTKESYCRISEG